MTRLALRAAWAQPFAATDFTRLWFAGLVIFVVRWLELLAMAVFVYQKTNSAFLVALVTLLRMVPLLLFGAVFGAIADRFERRWSLVGTLTCMMTASGTLGALAWFDALEVWHLCLASFANGVAWATDNPVRRVMIGDSMEPGRVSAAMSIDVGTNNASRMCGPVLSGAVLTAAGIQGVFTLSVLFYLVAILSALGLRYRNRERVVETTSLLARILDGFAQARRNRQVARVMLVTLIFNLFGWPFTSMVPVIGQGSLGLAAGDLGLFASMDGVGALFGAVLVAVYGRRFNSEKLFVRGSFVYLALIIVFGLLTDTCFDGAALLLTGVFSSAFAIFQSTLVYLHAPPEMRSRLLGVLAVCIGISPLGFLHVGLLADWIGVRPAVVLTGAEGLVAMMLTRRWWR